MTFERCYSENAGFFKMTAIFREHLAGWGIKEKVVNEDPSDGWYFLSSPTGSRAFHSIIPLVQLKWRQRIVLPLTYHVTPFLACATACRDCI